jgi:hypothetical protein
MGIEAEPTLDTENGAEPAPEKRMRWRDALGFLHEGTEAEYFAAVAAADPGEWWPAVDGLD